MLESIRRDVVRHELSEEWPARRFGPERWWIVLGVTAVAEASRAAECVQERIVRGEHREIRKEAAVRYSGDRFVNMPAQSGRCQAVRVAHTKILRSGEVRDAALRERNPMKLSRCRQQVRLIRCALTAFAMLWPIAPAAPKRAILFIDGHRTSTRGRVNAAVTSHSRPPGAANSFRRHASSALHARPRPRTPRSSRRRRAAGRLCWLAPASRHARAPSDRDRCVDTAGHPSGQLRLRGTGRTPLI